MEEEVAKILELLRIGQGKHEKARRIRCTGSTVTDAHVRDPGEPWIQRHQRRGGQPRRDQEAQQMLLCVEGIHDNPHRNSSWRRTVRISGRREWMEEGVEVWRWRLATGTS